MIATIAVIAAIAEKKKVQRSQRSYQKPLSSDRSDNNPWDRKSSISAIVVAAIAGEWFPYDRCDRWIFSQRYIAATTIAETENVPSQRLLSLPSLWSLQSLESGFHLIAVIAAIAEFFLSDRSDHSDHMETRLYCDKSMKRFAAS